MKQCIDCGQLFADTLGACPNCGCPADCCRDVAAPAADSATAQAAATMVQSTAAAATVAPRQEQPKRDRAHYVYECAVIFWHTFTNRYAKFDGRASRREFWSFMLTPLAADIFCPCLTYILPIVLLIPTLAVMIRRLHDGNHSGWWSCLPFVAIFFYLQKSDEGPNHYGVPEHDLGI